MRRRWTRPLSTLLLMAVVIGAWLVGGLALWQLSQNTTVLAQVGMPK
jgi:hypothetical protein